MEFHITTIPIYGNGENSLPDIALDSHGCIHMAFALVWDEGYRIYHSTNQTGIWETEAVSEPTNSYSFSSSEKSAFILINSTDEMFIFYSYYYTPPGESTQLFLKFALKNLNSDDDFVISDKYPADSPMVKAVAIGQDDTIYMLYTDVSGTVLATRSPEGNWVDKRVPYMGRPQELAVDSNDQLHVLVYNDSSLYNPISQSWEEKRSLEYWVKSSRGWTNETIENDVGRGYFAHIALNTTGSPRIMYGRDNNDLPASGQEVRYNERTEDGWDDPLIVQNYSFIWWVEGDMAIVGDEAHLIYNAPMYGSLTSYSHVMNYSYGTKGNMIATSVSTEIGGTCLALAIDDLVYVHLFFSYVEDSSYSKYNGYATTKEIVETSPPQWLWTEGGVGSITVNWLEPMIDNGITGYIVELSTDYDFSTILKQESVSSTARNYTFDGLASSDPYYFRVKAVYGMHEGQSSYPVQGFIKRGLISSEGGGVDMLLVGGLATITIVIIAFIVMMKRRK